jgi:hypothetical protein
MAAPNQQGTGLIATATPLFSKYVVVDGTWKVQDALEHIETKDGASQSANVSFFNPGKNISCDWVVKTGQALAAKGDIVADTTAAKYLVLEVDNSDFGGKPVKQSVKLYQRDSITLS